MKRMLALLLFVVSSLAAAESVKVDPKKVIKLIGPIDRSSAVWNSGNQMLSAAQKDPNEPIQVFLQSPGGRVDVYQHIKMGMLMARDLGATINCYVGERAYSVAAMITLHCSNVYVLKYGQVLFHSPATTQRGPINYFDARDLVEDLGALIDTMYADFKEAVKSTLSETDLRSRFDKNLQAQTYFTASAFNKEYGTTMYHEVDAIEGLKADELMERREDMDIMKLLFGGEVQPSVGPELPLVIPADINY